jgi:branched-chain amino acid transport system permease protein
VTKCAPEYVELDGALERLAGTLRDDMLAFILEQSLNGLQYGMALFLISAGLTLVFGVMGVLNLAHGSAFMFGAYAAAIVSQVTNNFFASVLCAIVVTGAFGWILEVGVIQRLYRRSHLDQVLATFALTLIFNGAARQMFGRQPYQIPVPESLAGTVEIGDWFSYPAYRLVLILLGMLGAALMYVLVTHTRTGMLLRAGSTHRDIAAALGANLDRLFAVVFALGAIMAGLAGAMIGPIQAVEPGMGEPITVLAFVVIVVGGVGSVRGAFAAAMLIGIVDTFARTLLPVLLKSHLGAATSTAIGGMIGAAAIYMLLAAVLVIRPQGLFSRV